MKYIFNFENHVNGMSFNREKLFLASLQKMDQLYYMLDTQFDGLYEGDALERRRQYGANSLHFLNRISGVGWLKERKDLVLHVFDLLKNQKVAVFRRGMHFYAETSYENLVPGDVVFLTKGDVVPADVRILFSKDFVVEQEVYTGSRDPVPKCSVCEGDTEVVQTITNLANICFWGTRILTGMARGVVVSTGKATYLAHLVQL